MISRSWPSSAVPHGSRVRTDRLPIERLDFDSYSALSDEAVAIAVGPTTRFVDPIPLSSPEPTPAARQGFSYHAGAELALA